MELDVGILYGIIAFCCALVNSIIQNRSNKAIFNKSLQKPFAALLVFFIIFSICDGIWGFLVSPKIFVNLFLLKVFTYTFHTGAALSAFMWIGYMMEYMRVDVNAKKFFNKLRYFIFIFQLILLFQNLFTNNLFDIADDYSYNPTPYRNLTFFVQFLYFGSLCLYSIFKVISQLHNRKNNPNFSRNVLIFLFSVTPLCFGIAQMVFPDGPFYSLGFMITSILIYGYNVSEEHEKYIHELHKKENNELSNIVQALSADYEAIYYVDLKTDRYKNFIKGTNYDINISNKLTDSDNFFKVLPENISKVVYEPDRDGLVEALTKENLLKELETKEYVSINYRLMLDGKPVYHQLKCLKSSSNSENEKLIVGVFNINTQMEKQEEINRNLREAKEKAESSNKAKSAFLFNMSHDIRTPMTAIQGFTELVEKNIEDKQKSLSYLEKIKISNGHLLKLINNVLDMARIENNKIVINEIPSDLEENISNTLSMMLFESKEKSIMLSQEFKNIRSRFVYADFLHLNQILINILNNAIKYTPTGGKVEVFIHQEEPDAEGKVVTSIKVSDTGIGMSKEFLEHIYEEFNREKSTTKSGVEGTGLGMSIVKQLVDLMNAKINIESEKNKGTTVEVIFNFKTCTQEEYEATQFSDKLFINSNIELKGKRILIVDDVEFNREITSEILLEEGVIVETADDGLVALELVQKNGPAYYDAVLMDIQMPTMDGYETSKKIRALGGDFKLIPIIAMTANAFEEDKLNAFAAQMNEHIAKPVTIDGLKNCLKKVLSLMGK